MNETSLQSLPGAEIVLAGVADIEAGRETVNANAVRSAARRLSAVGLASGGGEEGLAAHRLYAQLAEELGDGAHSRYNAILARVASFAGAAERARGQARLLRSRTAALITPRDVAAVLPRPGALADAERIERLARELGRVVPAGTKMYLTGGATAVLEGWRASTVDIDVRFEPDSDAALRRVAELKEELEVNVELASPLDFLPALPGWQERSRFRLREGNLEVFDFDPYSQALSKLARGFELDLEDVASMVSLGQVDPGRLRDLFDEIEAELFRFPAVEPTRLRAAVEALAKDGE